MRNIGVLTHRYLGLFIALFLFVSGLTGAIISWDHELDAALNPAFYHADWQQQAANDPLKMANQLEREHPDWVISFLPLTLRENEALNLFVANRNGDKDPLPFDQIAVHPVHGVIQAQRLWGDVSLARENLLPFLYKLHYSMHIPSFGAYELGVWFMGMVAIIWCVDNVIALWIAFPSRTQWRKSFQFRWKAGGYKLNFDLHRSGGVWIWLLLLIIAITSLSMNLGPQVVRPLVNQISPLSPSPFERALHPGIEQLQVKREDVLALAQKKVPDLGIHAPVGGIFYNRDFNIYGVGYFEPGNSHGDGGLGNPWLYFDGKTAAYLGADLPGQGSAGDVFMQVQFPLHSGRIIGLPGRILVSLLGLAVAVLSITGVIIWARKQRARSAKPATLLVTE